MHLQLLPKHLLGGKLKLGAAYVGSKVSHVGTLVKGEHHHVVVVALFVLDKQAFARQTVVDVDDLLAFLGGDDCRVSK